MASSSVQCRFPCFHSHHARHLLGCSQRRSNREAHKKHARVVNQDAELAVVMLDRVHQSFDVGFVLDVDVHMSILRVDQIRVMATAPDDLVTLMKKPLRKIAAYPSTRAYHQHVPWEDGGAGTRGHRVRAPHPRPVPCPCERTPDARTAPLSKVVRVNQFAIPQVPVGPRTFSWHWPPAVAKRAVLSSVRAARHNCIGR